MSAKREMIPTEDNQEAAPKAKKLKKSKNEMDTADNEVADEETTVVDPPNRVQIAACDFVAKKAVFKKWLREKKEINLKDLSAEESAKKFAKFVKRYNSDKLSAEYYVDEPIAPAVPSTPTTAPSTPATTTSTTRVAATPGTPATTTSITTADTLSDLTYDIPFKRAFSDDKNNLKELLNAIAEAAGDEPIVEVMSVCNPERSGTVASNHRSMFYDVICKIADGSTVIVELQRASQVADIVDRTVAYVPREYSVQYKGTEGFSVVPVRIIAILNFQMTTLQAKCGDLLQTFEIQPKVGRPNAALKKRYAELGKYCIVQLPLVPVTIEECKTKLEKFCFLIRNSHQLTRHSIPAALNTAPYDKVIQVAHESALSEADLLQYMEELEETRKESSSENSRALQLRTAEQTAVELARENEQLKRELRELRAGRK